MFHADPIGKVVQSTHVSPPRNKGWTSQTKKGTFCFTTKTVFPKKFVKSRNSGSEVCDPGIQFGPYTCPGKKNKKNTLPPGFRLYEPVRATRKKKKKKKRRVQGAFSWVLLQASAHKKNILKYGLADQFSICAIRAPRKLASTWRQW